MQFHDIALFMEMLPGENNAILYYVYNRNQVKPTDNLLKIVQHIVDVHSENCVNYINKQLENYVQNTVTHHTKHVRTPTCVHDIYRLQILLHDLFLCNLLIFRFTRCNEKSQQISETVQVNLFHPA